MRKPERELLQREKKRLGAQKKTKTPRRSSIGAFSIWGRLVGVAGPILLISLVAATFFTPLLAIEKIEVSGTERLDQAKVEKSLQSLVGRPLPTITEAEVGELLGDFGLVDTFAIQAQPPHLITVKIRERQPILIVPVAGKNFLYDAAGVKIAEATKTDSFPYLKFPGTPLADDRFEVAVEVLLSLPVSNYEDIFSIQVSKALTTTMVLRDSGIQVIWGGTDQALLKAEVLDSLLETGQKDGVTIDVSSPNSPVVTYPNY